MENNKNRWFYKVNEPENYKANKKAFTRFTMRIPDEYIPQLQALEGFEKLDTCKKSNKADRDKVKDNEFNVIPYDNSGAKDFVANHSVCVCNHETVEEVKEKIKSVCPTVSFKKSGTTITTQLYDNTAVRGIWTSKGEEKKIKYPICVLTFKRANKSGKTHMTLTRYKINHYLFVEPSQEEEYKKWYDPTYCTMIVGKEDWSKQNMGSTTVRNAILDFGKELGFDRVWMLDDNIKKYNRYYQGTKNEINSHEIFTHIEEYIKRYDNVGGVSHNFSPFIMEGDLRPCIVKNNKCYSSMLLRTDIDIRFRYKHQEDNLISMEYINKGYCNLCFNSILYDKDTSGTDKGGNREAIYKCKNNDSDGDGYKERFEYFMAQLFILKCEKKLKLIEGADIDDLVKRSKTMKSKDYHANCCYEYLVGNDNKNPRNDYQSDYQSDLLFVPSTVSE